MLWFQTGSHINDLKQAIQNTRIVCLAYPRQFLNLHWSPICPAIAKYHNHVVHAQFITKLANDAG